MKVLVAGLLHTDVQSTVSQEMWYGGGGSGWEASCSVSLSVFGGQVAVVRSNPCNFDVADSPGTQAHSRKLRADICPALEKGSFSVVHCTFSSIIFLFHSVQILS